LVIGSDVGIADGCQLNAGGEIEIGNGVLIGPCVLIWSQNHAYEDRDLPIREQGYKWSKVTIEDDVWIGAGAIILTGVRLSRGTVVAAGAVVTRSTDCYSIVAGVPARLLGMRRSRSRYSETRETSPGEQGAMGPQLS
jgi:acetyltransferase-like isoleucine patch superfamily enzyme